MSRNFYVLAATLLLFSMVSCGMSFVPDRYQPGLPENGSLWKTTALGFLVAGLAVGLTGTMTTLFEQVDRRHRERRLSQRHGNGQGAAGREPPAGQA